MSKKYYVVWKGRKTGVFDNWSEVKSYTQGQNDAQYMGFDNKQAAETAFASTYSKALRQRALTTPSSAKSSNAKSSKQASEKHLQSSQNKASLKIYSDGACSPNPGKSGTGLAIYQQGKLSELWYGLYNPEGTNNTAELNGFLCALRYAKASMEQHQSIEILTDSRYAIDCITKWAKGWKAKGWTRGKGEEIKNLEVIKQCFSLYQDHKNKLIITHVRGHANIEGNELADRMAVYARMKKQTGLIKFEQDMSISEILAMPSG
ncbi:ribonuclease H family protein [Thalassotalea aquiviva]|uniref:ribonuclease H family protein n=1 Tax=Thalassotalea aquiviva TaxID=3242415 RepID=UPI00352A6D82